MKTIILLSSLGTGVLLAEIFRFRKLIFPLVLIGLLAALTTAFLDWNTHRSYYNNMITFDNYAVMFSVVLCVTVLLWFLSNYSFTQEGRHVSDKSALAVYSLTGAVIIASYSNLVMLFIGIEVLSIPLYVLAGSDKDNHDSNEAAMKYFLMGAFASALLLMGIALVYGAAGTFDISVLGTYLSPDLQGEDHAIRHLSDPNQPLLYTGVLLILAGMAFKVSAVPFHFWAPDVYQGSPTPVTAFMSSVVKTAAFAAFLRLFYTCFASIADIWNSVILVISALTILLGNISAVYQTSVKRMLAWSSIAHAGYILIAILSLNQLSAGAVLYYSAAYSLSTIASFTVLAVLERSGPVTFDSLKGLSRRSPFLAFSMAVAIISLAGIPPLAGFFGKYYLLTSALQSGEIAIALIALLGSLIGLYYYLKVIIRMYATGSDGVSPVEVSQSQQIVLIVCILLTLILGLFPDALIRLV